MISVLVNLYLYSGIITAKLYIGKTIPEISAAKTGEEKGVLSSMLLQ